MRYELKIWFSVKKLPDMVVPLKTAKEAVDWNDKTVLRSILADKVNGKELIVVNNEPVKFDFILNDRVPKIVKLKQDGRSNS